MGNNDYSKEPSLTLVNFDTIGGGKLKQLVDNYMVTAVSEALMQKKFNNVEKGVIKINIEISVEPIDDMSYEIKGKVKKTLPQSSCVSIAVGDELGLYVRKDGYEGNPLQGTLEDHDEGTKVTIAFTGADGVKREASLGQVDKAMKVLKKRKENNEKVEKYLEKEGESSLDELKEVSESLNEDDNINDIFEMKKKTK